MSLYPPPQIIETEVFAELPESLRKSGATSTWATANNKGDTLHSFIEGPAFDRDGNLYIVDIPWGRIFRVSPAGTFDIIAEYDGEPNGLKIHKDGRLFVADYKNGVMIVDPSSGAVTPHCDRYRVEGLKGVNDLVFASNGDLFFTDQGLTGLHDPTGRVYRLRPEGRLDQLVDNGPSPNGLVLDASESWLYVAMTRANQVWRLPLLADGGTTKVGNFVQLSGGSGPDGMALDADGNLVVCHAGAGSVWIFSPIGEPLYRVRSCRGLYPTNCAYGGPENKTLYITESDTGTILRAELPVPGHVMYSHMD
ncbi:MAG: SMP-30/gluconolactonase/LRE family protein [Alphaproteobacteria bacterium]|nr:SMP-30/gluconolactonase/LRE family protein [Alphaproteobacteria bacterium]